MSDIDPTPAWLPIVREIIAGILSLIVMIAFVVLLLRALDRAASQAEFGPVKDLLAMINPIVGLVIGYYFSRVTSEARAERAEAAAAEHSRTSTTAQLQRQQSDETARAAQVTSQSATSALAELVQAVGAVQGGGQEAVAAVTAGTERARLELALARANRVLATADVAMPGA